MKLNSFFLQLALKEDCRSSQRSFDAILTECLELAWIGEILPPLIRNYLIAEVNYAHSHFGFAALSPAPRRLLEKHLVSQSGVSVSKVSLWLEAVCYHRLEDFNTLKLMVGEPDWAQLDCSFFRDLARRVLCAEENEIQDLGLGCWDREFILGLRGVVSQYLQEPAFFDASRLSGKLDARLDSIFGGNSFREALVATISEISENPLRLVLWRVAAGMGTPHDSLSDSQTLKDFDSPVSEERNSRVAALLIALYPLKIPDGRQTVEESPLTLNQLKRGLSANPATPALDWSLILNWLGNPQHLASLEAILEQTLLEAVHAGLVYAIQKTKTAKAYGLRQKGLKMISPFDEILRQTLIKNNSEQAIESGETRPKNTDYFLPAK